MNVHTFDFKRISTYFLLSSIVLYFIFLIPIHSSYYGGEDLKFLFGGWNKPCVMEDGFNWVKSLGRPLQAYMECASFKYASSLAGLKVIRFICILLFGLGMGLFADWLCTLGFSFWGAFCASGSLFLIPKLYSDTILTSVLALPFAVLFSVIAYRCICESHDYSFSDIKNKFIWQFLGMLFLLFALLTYPAMAFVFGSFILFKTFFSQVRNWPKKRIEISKEIFIFFFVCFIYFLWGQYRIYRHPRASIPIQYQMHANLNLHELVHRIRPILNVFGEGPWVTLFPQGFPLGGVTGQGWLTLLVLVLGVFIGFFTFLRNSFSRNQDYSFFTLIQQIFIVFILFGLCNAFYLGIPVQETMGSKLLFASVASGIPLLFWCVYQCVSIFPKRMNQNLFFAFLVVFFVIEGSQASLSTAENVRFFEKRFALLQHTVSEYLVKGNHLQRLHFIIPEPDHAYMRFFWANAVLLHTLGQKSYQIKWCSLPRGYEGKEEDHQAEALACIHSLSKGTIAITYTRPGEHYLNSKDMLLMGQEVWI